MKATHELDHTHENSKDTSESPTFRVRAIFEIARGERPIGPERGTERRVGGGPGKGRTRQRWGSGGTAADNHRPTIDNRNLRLVVVQIMYVADRGD